MTTREKETILVVDDNRDVRIFLEDILKTAGYRVLIARDGAEGLERARKSRPDLMMLDLQMPELDGIAVLKRMNTERLNIPVIFMTAHGQEAIAVEVFRLGVKDYIMKGAEFTVEQLLQTVERSLIEVRLRRQKDQLTERLIASNGELTRRLKELRILYNIGKSVTALMDMDGLMRRVVGAATLLTNSEEGAIFLFEKGEMICRALKRYTDERPYPYNRPLPEPLAEEAFNRREIITQRANTPARTGGGGSSAPTAWSALAAPLVLGDRAIGALVVKNITADTPDFGEHDGELLAALADYAAIAYKAQGRIDPAPIQKEFETTDKQVFISYSRSDWDGIVEPLVSKLRSAGLSVWVDQHLIEGGQEWLTKIGEALVGCRVLVLCVTPEAMKSHWVQWEYRYFFINQKPIIPIICRDAALPPELVTKQHIQLAETHKLIDRLKHILQKQA